MTLWCIHCQEPFTPQRWRIMWEHRVRAGDYPMMPVCGTCADAQRAALRANAIAGRIAVERVLNDETCLDGTAPF